MKKYLILSLSMLVALPAFNALAADNNLHMWQLVCQRGETVKKSQLHPNEFSCQKSVRTYTHGLCRHAPFRYLIQKKYWQRGRRITAFICSVTPDGRGGEVGFTCPVNYQRDIQATDRNRTCYTFSQQEMANPTMRQFQ